MPCKDCEPGSKRPAPFPGPRCATHDRARKAQLKVKAHARRLESIYGIDAAFYQALLEVQGGRCAICQRATGARRRLAVDHDHAQARLDGHPEDQGCLNCVRGALCKGCNTMLGRMRDSSETFRRAADYLDNWPSRAVRNASAPADSLSAEAGSSAAGAVASAA